MHVTHYGIHWTVDGIAFLEQGGPKGGANALGLAMKSPFRVRLQGRIIPCNHNIPLAAPALNPVHKEIFARIESDPLIQAMLPLPKPEGHSGIWYFEDQDDRLGVYLSLLSRMSSPVHIIVRPIWTLKLNNLIEELAQTNAQPLALTDITSKDTETISKIAKIASQSPRRLILAGRKEIVLPSSVERSTTRIMKSEIGDILMLPWEAYGAHIVRKYMRNELDQSGKDQHATGLPD